jgi:3',5'-cyclic AMP phosphodiesterase CpdA
MKPHKHAALIKAWADGAQIQHHHQFEDRWDDVDNPRWLDDHNYRIKPEPKPDQTLYFNIGQFGAVKIDYWQRELCAPNIAATFDGETFKLKSVEVLK